MSVIEDEVMLLKTLSELLESNEYTVSKAGDAEKDIDVFTKTSLDSVICDISIPKKDGSEVLKTLKNVVVVSKSPPLRSAKKLPKFVSKARKIGAVNFINESYSTVELLKFLDHRLKKD